MLREVIDRGGLPYELVGVGGVSTADHARQYLSAGATHLQLATAAMVNPRVGLEIRQGW
jgi:dihydroorotate dehydrogenase